MTYSSGQELTSAPSDMIAYDGKAPEGGPYFRVWKVTRGKHIGKWYIANCPDEGVEQQTLVGWVKQ